MSVCLVGERDWQQLWQVFDTIGSIVSQQSIRAVLLCFACREMKWAIGEVLCFLSGLFSFPRTVCTLHVNDTTSVALFVVANLRCSNKNYHILFLYILPMYGQCV